MRYVDNAASAPVTAEVRAAIAPFLTTGYGNPSSAHDVGRAAHAALDRARRVAAAVVGMRPADVVFTSGGTEANNLAVKGIVLAARGRHIVTTAIEHSSVRESVAYLERLHGARVTVVPVDRTGRVDPDDVAAALTDDTALVTIGLANNEIGTVQPAARIAAVCRAAGVPLHLDAVQGAGWLPLSSLGADAVSLAGHKIGAPQGTGLVAIRSRIPVEPLLHGGGQERGRRAGTESVAGAVGLATALAAAEAHREDNARRVRGLRDAFIREVEGRIPQVVVTGHPTERLPSIASFCVPGVNGEALLVELERDGVIASSGSACRAGSTDPSPVLLALGLTPDEARTAVRFSLAHDDTRPLGPVAEALAAAVGRLAV
ncbi:cysteine desulfurase family protein [Microbacterium excoecariae]|uniref:cysteine desulfurase family protein n=1 Tax=Microbacterium excoecariae TaxID=2715210 RepID=UPI00140D5316|nr:cysteine desulfurase family protein [Microbacterium excoecariae]NHI17336.1 cysteine desulfurase [Microbacterium excoecariae]